MTSAAAAVYLFQRSSSIGVFRGRPVSPAMTKPAVVGLSGRGTSLDCPSGPRHELGSNDRTRFLTIPLHLGRGRAGLNQALQPPGDVTQDRETVRGTSMKRRLRELLKIHQKFGIGAACRYAIGRVGQAIIGLQIIEVIWLKRNRLKLSLEVDPRFRFRFLSADEVAKFATESRQRSRPVDGRPGCCRLRHVFAALDGERLAAYGWYALGSIEAEHNFGVALSYPPQVAYMYKGFARFRIPAAPACTGSAWDWRSTASPSSASPDWCPRSTG